MKPHAAFLLLGLLALAGCYDPVHLDAVAVLGPEAEGVPRGPEHRAGQPCTTCHGGDGPGSPEFAVAGTVFDVRGTSAALPGATVTITDAHGDVRALATNRVGNFYITKDQWSPAFPLRVAIDDGKGAHKEMLTTIGRSGSCATCHVGNGDAQAMPAVFVRDR